MTHALSRYIVETDVNSWTGPYLYSDFAYQQNQQNVPSVVMDSTLNKWARQPIIGIIAGIARMALAIIHTIGHLLAAGVTLQQGHLYHALKGCCEFLRGVIEATPIVGRVFSHYYSSIPANGNAERSWWIMKIFNPQHPDALDQIMHAWAGLANSPNYIRA
jgi:hypothetical protein